MTSVSVREIVQNYNTFSLRSLNENADFDREISVTDLNRPGLALAGFFESFAHGRVQVLGRGEISFLQQKKPEETLQTLETLFSYDLPLLVFTHDNAPPEHFLKFAVEKKVPVFSTPLSTNQFVVQFSVILDELLAPRLITHGVLVEVFGVGVLIVGESGVGKSETALELVERGHRLVADDAVEIICLDESRLYGRSHSVLDHHMEIRGIGIISVRDLFGSGSVRRQKRIDVIIRLETWNEDKEYERLGLYDEFEEIHGVKIPRLEIPVLPGRNVPILVEVAAKNYRLKQMGIHSARNFDEALRKEIMRKEEKEG